MKASVPSSGQAWQRFHPPPRLSGLQEAPSCSVYQSVGVSEGEEESEERAQESGRAAPLCSGSGVTGALVSLCQQGEWQPQKKLKASKRNAVDPRAPELSPSQAASRFEARLSPQGCSAQAVRHLHIKCGLFGMAGSLRSFLRSLCWEIGCMVGSMLASGRQVGLGSGGLTCSLNACVDNACRNL